MQQPLTTPTVLRRVRRVEQLRVHDRSDAVVVEEPLRIHVRQGQQQHVLGSTMRTPGSDVELAVGLAVGEGVVKSRSDVVAVRPCADGRGPQANDVTVVVAESAHVDPARMGRVATPSSACGMCGRDEIDAIAGSRPQVRRDVAVSSTVLAALPEIMRRSQRIFGKTGGLHAAALAEADGALLVVREDVGRHNAVDKAVGAALLNEWSADVLLVSGRAGFEIVQKAAMAGIPVVASVSAPTSLAVDAARACGLTLAAFVRGESMNLYAGAESIDVK